MMRYADRPWLKHFTEEQLEDVENPPSVLHSFLEAAERAPARPALRYFDGTVSYGELDALSDGLARRLADRGFAPGDRLAVMLQNVPQFVIALLAAWKAGGAVVPVNPMYKEGELAHILADAGATAIVCSERAWHDYVRATAALSPVRIALTASELDLQTRDDPRVLTAGRRPADDAEDVLTAARAAAGPRPDVALPRSGDTALISYTSGTSGRPKGAINTHGNISFNAHRQVRVQDFPADAVVFALAPLFHITGLVCELAAALSAGHTVALAYRFEPGVVLDAFREHRPVYTVGPSTAFMALLARPDATAEDFASFQLISSGGAPLPPAVVEAFRIRSGGLYLANGYGLTECTAPCASVPPGREAPVDPESGTLAVGVPGPGTMIRILDDKGAEVPFGESGEIAVSGPMVVPGYWNKPEESAAALPGGELLTGDIGFMDEDGWLYVVDRKKDMISASGFKVWPREVEDVLYTHPAVREAAVVGVPDSYRGESVKAYVSLRPGASAEPAELIAYCKERLAAYKYPREVEMLVELPKTATGKILRRELKTSAG
ncbi:long-chain acyl-CoA synthetase [Streptomyces sp. DvalAA-14]|uniref:AMP-binding protein n=1 Tax=unclassified Streptomyces TaxID=2593676 RepID=UPI00081B94DC|nr:MULTISPECIES: AMP-binding protein [unclassified Streptomyces]MYS21952.1 AMP-binding protein [Streptomyces sp. SID4948]SCE05120.1 long-chain acyl-CoA synthetase [Streptomyces sp. DvalAA-14]